MLGVIPLEALGPEERLPAAVVAWLDPRRPLPPNVRMVAVNERPPALLPLTVALLLGASAGALGLVLAKEARHENWGSFAVGIGLLVPIFVAAWAFARRGLSAVAERLNGGRRARRGVFFGELGGEAVLVCRLRAGEARLLRRGQIFGLRLKPSDQPGRLELELRCGAEEREARPLWLRALPEAGARAAAAGISAWLGRSAAP